MVVTFMSVYKSEVVVDSEFFLKKNYLNILLEIRYRFISDQYES